MPRNYASINLTIWADSDWRALSPNAKLLYITVLTSPTMKSCGVADWKPRKIAHVTGMTLGDVIAAGAELIRSMHLVIDESTEEVLVRSYLRHDGLMKIPNMAAGAANHFGDVASETVRGVWVHELRRLKDDKPELKGWSSKIASLLKLDPIDPSDIASEPSIQGFGQGFDQPFGQGLNPNPSVKGSVNPSPSPAPAPAPHTSTRRGSQRRSVDKQKDAVREDVETLCQQLVDGLKRNGVDRTITEDWRKSARLLLDKDGRDLAQALALITWVQGDEFWCGNVMSMDKFRKQYDQLLLKSPKRFKLIDGEGGGRTRSRYPTADEIEAAGDPPSDPDAHREWYRNHYGGRG